jgi:hypothetical protein
MAIALRFATVTGDLERDRRLLTVFCVGQRS